MRWPSFRISLAAQGFLLLSFVAYNRLRFADEIAHCQKAVMYAYESGDRILLVESQRMLGSAFLDAGQLDKMLNAYLLWAPTLAWTWILLREASAREEERRNAQGKRG